MPWFKVDDALHSHPKARRCGLDALGLWAVAGSHCMAYLTDGYVEPWFIQSWPRGEELAARLVDADLWDTHPDGGWQFHDWDQYQPTKAQVEEEREKERERKAKWRESRKDAANTGRPDGTDGGTDGGSPTVRRRGTDAAPTRPDPTLIRTSEPKGSDDEPERLDAKRLTTTLVDALESRGVKTPTSLKAWNVEARRLLDIDHRPLEEALRVLAWSQHDPFWSRNILSMPKFRQKYDQLRLNATDGAVPDLRGPEELIRDCWRTGDPSAVFTATQWTRPTLVWPEDSEMVGSFDRDEYRRKFWREWLEENHTAILDRLRRTS